MEIGNIALTDDKGYRVHFKDDVYITIFPLTPARINRFRSQCTRQKFKRGQAIDIVDDKKLTELLNREMIVGWEGITKDKKEFPCTPENVDYLMLNSLEFNEFVQSAALDINGYLEKQEERAEKN